MLNPVLADLLRAEGQAAFDFGLLNGEASGRAGVRSGQAYADGRAVLNTSGLGVDFGRLNPSNYIWTARGVQYWPPIWEKIQAIDREARSLRALPYSKVAGINTNHNRVSSGSYRRNMFRLYAPRRTYYKRRPVYRSRYRSSRRSRLRY